MKQEILAYLRKGTLDELGLLQEAGITEDEFHHYIGVVNIFKNPYGELEDRVLQVMLLISRGWGKCITGTDIKFAISVIGLSVSLDERQSNYGYTLIKRGYRVLNMQHTQEHTLDEWVKELYGYCQDIRKRGFVKYCDKGEVFFYTQEEYETKFYRVTGFDLTKLSVWDRRQLYEELGWGITRGATEDKLKQIIGEIL